VKPTGSVPRSFGYIPSLFDTDPRFIRMIKLRQVGDVDEIRSFQQGPH
jgi:hypothetical protein